MSDAVQGVVAKLKRNDLVYFVEYQTAEDSITGNPRRVPFRDIIGDRDGTQIVGSYRVETFLMRQLGFYQSRDSGFLNFKPVSLLNAWDHTTAEEHDLTGLDIRLAGVENWDSRRIKPEHIRTIYRGKDLKSHLVAALEQDRDEAVKHIREPAMQQLIYGRYLRLIDAVKRL